MNQVPPTGAFPPGHFYSALPDLVEVMKEKERIFNGNPGKAIPGIDLKVKQQISLLEKLSKYYRDLPFSEDPNPSLRYYFSNPAYGHGDGLVLYSMIRHIKPKQIIEVGSGFSSAAIMDTNDLFFKSKISCTFIEPYPELLQSLISGKNSDSCNVVNQKVQSVDLSVFKKLKSGDILLIDSTHVSKVGSDVNYIFFHILPILRKGVIIHFHDMFYPFEYPIEWISQGIFWNEDYLMRAFLMNNKAYEIMYFAAFIARFYRNKLIKALPLAEKNTGASLWIKKIM